LPNSATNFKNIYNIYKDSFLIVILQDDSQVSNDVIAFSSEDIDDMYDVPRKPNIKKSNSRVSSNGKLRLRVESFRNSSNGSNSNNNNNAKSSSGTQTDISVVRNSSKPEPQQHQEQSAYTGQFKKKAAPSKPARLLDQLINQIFLKISLLMPKIVQKLFNS
jgi:hypothetical protein